MNLTNLIRSLIKAAGAPVTLDELMQQLPDDSDRTVVAARCRALKHDGELATSIEDGKVAYRWTGAAAGRQPTLTDRIRDILRGAGTPMTSAEVFHALPEGEKLGSVQSLLSQGARNGEFNAVSAGGKALAYSLAGGGGINVAVNVGNVNTAPPAVKAAKPAARNNPTAAAPIAHATLSAEQPTLAAALDAALNRAEDAREAYVLSLVDPDIYTSLCESVDAARVARDTYAGGAK